MAGYCLFSTPIGACGIAWRGDAAIATRLPDDTPDQTARWLASRTGACRGTAPGAVRSAIDAMIALFEGEKTDLSDIECDFGNTDPLSLEIYAHTRAIAAGETATYGDIAIALGGKHLAQRVGQALGRNPLPIIVPCHRILGANGRLVGFSAHGGVETKLRMLRIEGAKIGPGPGLFDDLPLATRPRH